MYLLHSKNFLVDSNSNSTRMPLSAVDSPTANTMQLAFAKQQASGNNSSADVRKEMLLHNETHSGTEKSISLVLFSN